MLLTEGDDMTTLTHMACGSVRSRGGMRAAVGIARALGFVIASAFLATGSQASEVAPAGEAPLAPPASSEEMSLQWPRFRGPGGLGISPHQDVPVEWDGATGKNILWKTETPLPGASSPVVWKNRIFLSGSDKDHREVYCLDAATGNILWRTPLPKAAGAPVDPPTVLQDDTFTGGYAASTLATDGRFVYAMFTTGDIAALLFEGRLAWTRNLGAPVNHYGHATSLLTHGSRLIVQFDQGSMPDENLSALLALESETGKEVWKSAPRPVPNSWSTPIVIPVGKHEEIVTSGSPWVIAYDPEKGTELWRAECLAGEVATSLAFGSGVVLAVSKDAKCAAILPGGQGNVTATNVLWNAEDGLPSIASPLVANSFVFLADDNGLLTCYGGQDGAKMWEHDFETGFRSSPAFAEGRVYALDADGVMHIVAAANEFKEIAASPLGEPAEASPAFADGRIYLRGVKSIFAIGKKP